MSFWNSLSAVLHIAIAYGMIYLIATLGEIVTQRSGIMNLGVEGMMMVGGFLAIYVTWKTGSPLLGLLIGIIGGAVLGGFHALVSIRFKASQVVSGLALTILGTGLANFFGTKSGYQGARLAEQMSVNRVKIPILGDIPYIGDIIFNQSPIVYVGIILTIAISIFLFKTRTGLRLRAVGENPAAADAAGIKVYRFQYMATIFGGAMSGLAGAYMTLSYSKGWETGAIMGAGWIAVALVIFAFWKPSLALLGSLFFGFLYALKFYSTDLGIRIPSEFLEMLPYALTIIILILVSRKGKESAGGPAALSVPYDREER